MHKNNLIEIRNTLLHLHKSLLEFEKKRYEGKFGKVVSPWVMLKLLMENPQFSWLRQISELIVGIDELLESKEVVEGQKYIDTISYVKKLLQPEKEGNNFAKNYYEAIHHEPAVALAHAKVQAILDV